ncbi:MAG: hypothetical protein KDD42_01050, partial [Bdellovibrionales bacterium]|nr:hypothetical protein [Bdellovibrionales bacterium]
NSGERGSLREFVGWNNCAYVSFSTLNGDFYLDSWNIADPESPTLVSEISFGNINDDRQALLPVAHLKLPRDLAVFDSHLILWTNNKGQIYPLEQNCEPGPPRDFAFDSGLGQGMGRLHFGGQMATTDHFANYRRGQQLINFQDPLNPFLQTTAVFQNPLSGTFDGLPASLKLSADRRVLEVATLRQARSEHMRSFWNNILPDLLHVDSGDKSLQRLLTDLLDDSFVREQQERLIDILASMPDAVSRQQMFQVSSAKLAKLRLNRKRKQNEARSKKQPNKKKIFKKPQKKKKKTPKSKRRAPTPVDSERDSTSNDDARDDAQENDSDRDDDAASPEEEIPREEAPRRGESTLSLKVLELYQPNQLLETVLSRAGVRANDKLPFALEKAIGSHLSYQVDEVLGQNILTLLMQRWRDRFLALPEGSVSDLSDHLDALLNTKLTSSGLVSYLLHDILGPLIGNPSFMQFTLDQGLDSISDNDLSDVIDQGLALYHTTMPIDRLLSLLGFRRPACFSMPRSARQFLEAIFVDTGPRLNPRNPLFYEMIKLAAYYFGETDFSEVERELDREIRSFHRKLSNEAVSQTLSFFSSAAEGNSSLTQLFEQFGAQYSLRPTVAKLLARAIVSELQEPGLMTILADPIAELTIGEYLEQYGLYIDLETLPRGARLATVSDLVDLMEERGLGDLSLVRFFEKAKRADLGILRTALHLPMEQAVTQIFGAQSFDVSLNKAIERLILGRIDPAIMGGLVKSILDATLSQILEEGGLVGVLGTYGLAAQGDCISQWIVAIEIAAAAAQGSLVLEPAGLALEAIDLALNAAYEAAVLFAVKSVFGHFFEEIFQDSDRSYRSWYTSTVMDRNVISLNQITNRSARIVDTAVHRDRVALLQRDVGSIGAIPGDDTTVTLVTFDPRDPVGTLNQRSLGEWQSITSVRFEEDYLLLVGHRLLGPRRTTLTAMVLRYTDPGDQPSLLSGMEALAFSAAPEFQVLRNGQSFGIISQLGQVVVFDR